jgi:uncharacterized protein (DUF697 family)
MMNLIENALVRGGIAQEREVLDRLFRILFKVIHDIPHSAHKKQSAALWHARQLLADASLKAAGISGALALPPGPWGWLTILPDLAAIWRLQAHLVADIGAVYGKQGNLTQESMIYCLFRHAAAQVVRDLVTRMGERIIVQHVSLQMAENIIAGLSVRVIRRVARGGVWRLLPAIGAFAVAAYAYYDTKQVGRNAIEFFSRDVEVI